MGRKTLHVENFCFPTFVIKLHRPRPVYGSAAVAAEAAAEVAAGLTLRASRYRKQHEMRSSVQRWIARIINGMAQLHQRPFVKTVV